MQIAEELYNEEALGAKAHRLCVEFTDEELGGENYTTFIFEDGSKLILGENGYIGCELKP